MGFAKTLIPPGLLTPQLTPYKIHNKVKPFLFCVTW